MTDQKFKRLNKAVWRGVIPSWTVGLIGNCFFESLFLVMLMQACAYGAWVWVDLKLFEEKPK